MSAALSWYRLELGPTGAVLSSRVVDTAGTSGGGVFYVRAVSAEKAAKRAYLDHNAALLRARRAELAAKGLCRCGRPRDRKGPRCVACCVAQSADNARRALRDKGVAVLKPDRREALAARKDEDRDAIRLDTLQQVNRRFLALPKGDFLRWLRSEMEKISGKRVA